MLNMLDASLSAPDPRLRPVAPVVAVRQHRADAVLDCLAALSDIQRRTIVLACYRHMSGREVADALSVDVRTVYSHLHDALTAMKCQLDGPPHPPRQLWQDTTLKSDAAGDIT